MTDATPAAAPVDAAANLAATATAGGSAATPAPDAPAAASTPAVAVAAALPRPDPRVAAEKCLLAFLTVLDNLSNAAVLFGPQAPTLLVTGLPPAAGPVLLAGQCKDAAGLVTTLQVCACV